MLKEKERSFSRIRVHGMSPKESLYGEPITLPSGEQMQIIIEPEEKDDLDPVFALNLGGISARYLKHELEEIGDGNPDVGIMKVVQEVRSNPDNFQSGDPRPFEADIELK